MIVVFAYVDGGYECVFIFLPFRLYVLHCKSEFMVLLTLYNLTKCGLHKSSRVCYL